MSDKLTAYRGEMFSSQQDGEAPQQNYGIDPNTGLPNQSGYGQPMDHQGQPQGGLQGNHGFTGEGQVADQTYYQQTDQYQGQQAGFQQQETYQQPDQYQQQVQQQAQQQGQYSQTDYNQAQYGQQQYGQDQAAYSAQDQNLQQYQDPYGNNASLNGLQSNELQGQYGQLDQSNSGLQTDYMQQNQGYVEETDPYMAAHQNATLPYDPSNDALGQAGQPYGAGQDQQGYVQQYQDPNAGFSEYSTDHSAYAQHYQDPNAVYGDYQQGAVAGLPAPDGFAGSQQHYQDPNAGADYGAQYNNQGLQPLQNNAQPGMIGGYGQQAVDPAVMAANQGDASYQGDIQSSGRKSFLVGTMILGSVIIGGGVAFAYKYSGDASSDSAPVITSEDSGIKSKPDNPGGREFAHKNKKIFARLGDPGAQTEAGIVASREPEVVESLRGEVKDAANQVQKLGDNSTDTNGGPRRVRTYRIDRNGNQILDSAVNQAKLAGQDVKDIPGVTADTGQPARTVRTLKANGAKKVQEKSIQIARAQAKAPPVNRVASNDGNYVVQISARRTQTDALAAFSGLQSKYGSVLGGYRPLIQRADLGSRGIWFRLRVGPMQSREDAANVCAKLKSKGMKNCLVASR